MLNHSKKHLQLFILKVYDNLKLKIPRNLPPSGFPHCEFIDCSYFVHAVAKTAKINDDIVVKLPLIIMAGEDADTELDDDDPFEAGLNILVILFLFLNFDFKQ